MSTLAPWFPYARTGRDVRPRLLCFPHAGGCASAYRSWSAMEGVEVLAIQWPGREGRLGEVPFRRLGAMVDAAVQAARRFLEERPYAVFGHSLGAKIAYEFCRKVASLGLPPPRRLFVAGCPAANLGDRSAPLHGLSDDKFLAAIADLGGSPPSVLEAADLMALLLPMLRADYTASETYLWRPGPRLVCPISALGGEDDADVSLEELAAWAALTDGKCETRLFPGGHFFVSSDATEVMDHVRLRFLADRAAGEAAARCASAMNFPAEAAVASRFRKGSPLPQ